MVITLNGKKESLDSESLTVLELLKLRKIQPETVSVQLNGRVLSQSDFPHSRISDGSEVKILYFMGGGLR